MIRRLVAEGLGTGILLLAVTGSGIMAQAISGGNTGVALLANAIATGCVLYVLITILGPISAAFNSVVTLIALFQRQINPVEAILTIAAQIAGGIAGVWIAHAQFALPILQTSTHDRSGMPQLLSEAIATFGLILTIHGGLRHAPDRIATLVALYITAAYWFTASTSFANPAATIARSLTNTFAGIAPGDVVGFIVAEIIGGLTGWLVARWIFAEPRPAI
jgi:glycerol uptake facilitator-like aquaporin